MSLLDVLGINVVEKNTAQVTLTMPVDETCMQPAGIVHGGINAVLAETAASIGASEAFGPGNIAVGVNVTTHHLAMVQSGQLVAVATPVKNGQTTAVWAVKTYNPQVIKDPTNVEKEGYKQTSYSTVTLMKKALQK